MDGGDDQAAKPMRLIVKLPKLSRAQDQGPESMDVEPAAGTAAVAREVADQAAGAQGEASPAGSSKEAAQKRGFLPHCCFSFPPCFVFFGYP